MALQLAQATGFGETYDFWRIVTITIDKAKLRSSVSIGLFKSSVETQSVAGRNYSWDGSDFPFSLAAIQAEDPWKITYDKLKLLPEWEGAIDV